MAMHLAREAGPQARVLVDTGHHYAGQNIEQVVAWLLHTGMLGGFHFNDRRYADDDLTLGSIDPYQVFRIFHEILCASADGPGLDIAFMIDQSHNLKGKMEAMIQTVVTAQEIWVKAALVDQEELSALQTSCEPLVKAEETFRGGRSGTTCGRWSRHGARCAAYLPNRSRRCGRVDTWSALHASAAAGKI